MRSHTTLRTDLGTVLLHWSLVAALLLAAATGLSIASDRPSLAWLRSLEAVLPTGNVWPLHVGAGLALAALAVAYICYMRAAGLGRRIRLDGARTSSLGRGGPARWGGVHVILCWLLFAALCVLMATGVLLYLGHGGVAATIHFYAAVLVIAFPPLHVAALLGQGGLGQLLRILRPVSLERAKGAPMQPLTDALIERIVGMEAHPAPLAGEAAPRQGRVAAGQGATLHAHPLPVALAAGLTLTAAAYTAEVTSRDTLVVGRIEKAAAPRIDGDLSEPVWRKATAVEIVTSHGANLGGSGSTTVEIRAAHDGEQAYFAISWADPTRSLKHLPLVKKADGWWLLHEGYDIEDEDHYYEDKLAVMLARSPAMAGGATHIGARPLAGQPAAYSGRGLHYTTDGSIVDVWHWKAVRGGLLGFVDDNHFGPPLQATAAERDGAARYKAGYAADPGKAFYANNFKHEAAGGYGRPVQPVRLPRDLAVTAAAMGRIDLDPEHGEGEAVRWWLTSDESVPYSSAADARIPVGTVIPGVLIAGDYTGDRADVRCAARWSAGRWTLEIVRKLDTGSRFDVPIASGVHLWVAAFDHSQTRHTRHLRPVKLEVR